MRSIPHIPRPAQAPAILIPVFPSCATSVTAGLRGTPQPAAQGKCRSKTGPSASMLQQGPVVDATVGPMPGQPACRVSAGDDAGRRRLLLARVEARAGRGILLAQSVVGERGANRDV